MCVKQAGRSLSVTMETGGGLHEPLWRDPGLTLVLFYLPAERGTRQPAAAEIFAARAHAPVPGNDLDKFSQRQNHGQTLTNRRFDENV